MQDAVEPNLNRRTKADLVVQVNQLTRQLQDMYARLDQAQARGDKPEWAKQTSEMSFPELQRWAKGELVLAIGAGRLDNVLHMVLNAAWQRGHAIGKQQAVPPALPGLAQQE